MTSEGAFSWGAILVAPRLGITWAGGCSLLPDLCLSPRSGNQGMGHRGGYHEEGRDLLLAVQT